MVSFYFANGHWPSPMCLHSCDNPPCCNEVHLREGTGAENADDRDRRGRQAAGARNGSARLTDAQAVEVKRRVLSGEGQSALAREFGISPTTVWEIKNGRKWGHL
jgi:DNA-binding CsgD family transcriptional regulator